MAIKKEQRPKPVADVPKYQAEHTTKEGWFEDDIDFDAFDYDPQVGDRGAEDMLGGFY